MTTVSYSRATQNVATILISASEIPTAANQTAADYKWTLPAGYVVNDVYVSNVGGTITSTGTLTNLNVTVGTASAGAQYMAAADLKAAGGSSTTIAAALPAVSTSAVPLFVSVVPVGSGGNWSTFTLPVSGSATLFKVCIIYSNLNTDGDIIR